MKLAYPAVFCYYNDDRQNGYVVTVPDLPGCSTWGETLTEAIFMGIDAASGWVLGELADGRPLPKASTIEDIDPKKYEDKEYVCRKSFVNILALDMDSYAKKFRKKNMRNDVRIHEWQDTFVNERQVSYA